MRQQLSRLLCRAVCLGTVLLAATAVRAELIAHQESVDSFVSAANVGLANLAHKVSLAEIGESPSWAFRTGELAAIAPNELEMKEFHPAPEPSGLVLVVIAALGGCRLLRKRK